MLAASWRIDADIDTATEFGTKSDLPHHERPRSPLPT